MNTLSFYASLALAFAIGITTATLLFSVYLKPRLLARGYSQGHRAGHGSQQRVINDYQARVKAMHNDLGQIQHLRDVERQAHKQALEAMMQDADARIAVYARRALTDEDHATLQALAALLDTAAATFAGLQSSDKATLARQLQQRVINLRERMTATSADQSEQAA